MSTQRKPDTAHLSGFSHVLAFLARTCIERYKIEVVLFQTTLSEETIVPKMTVKLVNF